MLRLDWNLLFNMINLVILYFLMKRFMFKPIREILEKRQKLAEEQFAQADAKAAQAKECQEKYEALLQDAENEKERLLKESRADASKEYGAIVAEAKEKAGEIVAKAKQDAELEKQAAMDQTDAAIRDLVVDAAARMVGAGQDAQSDRMLYDHFLARAEQNSQQ